MERSDILQEWPRADLEEIVRCPYCDSANRSVAHADVRDWFFRCAPGSWTYWVCDGCRSLYLSPRPTGSSIDRAYSAYYTHSTPQRRFLNPEPFPVPQLSRLPPGSLLDVGCGDGDLMRKARAMGWDVHGIEIDDRAAKVARQSGLRVVTAGFEALANMPSFDCVVCLHVLEHVHDPLCLIHSLIERTKGTLFISLPNEGSLLHRVFKKYWRGLEAPRHLTLPSVDAVIYALRSEGGEVTTIPSPFYTFGASMQMKNGHAGILTKVANKILILATSVFPFSHSQDMIQLVVHRSNP